VTKERRAVAAFLVLAALAVLLAVLVRPSSTTGTRARTVANRGPKMCCPNFPNDHFDAMSRPRSLARTLARTMANTAQAAERAALRREAAVASVCRTVPLYPLARPATRRRDPALLRAVLGVPGVPVVNRMERFSLGRSDWLGGSGVAPAYAFYGREMRPIGFASMPEATRRRIGVRPTGPVDSPPILFANRTGAALLQAPEDGVVRLTLFCGPVEL